VPFDQLHTRICVLLVLLLVLLAPANGAAQETSAQQDRIARLTKPLTLDGKMGDPGWKSATVYRGFKTVSPNPGKLPSERTEVYLAQDSKTLYVALRSFDDHPNEIQSATPIPGNPGKDDRVEFCLDTYDDALSGFFFLVTPGNAQAQGILDSNGKAVLPLNANWQSAASIDKEGWIAEMAIPLGGLPFSGSARVNMSFKVARFISRKDEESDFPEIDPDQMNLEQFHRLVLSDVNPSAVSDADVFRQALEDKRRERVQLQAMPYEQRGEKWGHASVLDYLVFPSRELSASDQPFHFHRAPKDRKVAARLEKMEYAHGRQVENLERFLTRSSTTSFIVIKDDAIRYEGYFNGSKNDSIFTSFSVAKSFDSALVGIAIDDGKIASVHDPITKYLPEIAKRDPRFASITIRDLLQMSAGIRYSEDSPYHDDDVTYRGANLRKAALENTAIVDPPAKYFLYNDYHPLLIGLILERATGEPVSQYLQEKLWGPLGMQYSGSWSTDWEQPPFEKMLVGINARAIDFAKFGRLMLNDGRWDGRQILSERWVQESTQEEEKPAEYYRQDADFFANGHYYKYFWWGDKRPGDKSDFHAAGNRGQIIYISPQKGVVIVRTGFDSGIPTGRWVRLFRELADNL
jgi:CubicO group peptidase (beta-lactamase class C family)